MPIAEGLQATLIYRAYASGSITANTEDQAPTTSGGQYLRKVSHTLNLTKQTYASQEIRADRSVVDMRHGTRIVTGDVQGELSPLSYFPLIEAIHRDTSVSAITLGASQLTSVAFSSGSSNCTFGGGDPVTSGLREGDIIRFTGTTAAANNSKNFTITGFSGASNRVVALYPAPTTAAADISFTVTRPGKTTVIPLPGSFVSRKFGFEAVQEDLDQSRLFTECRVSGYTITLPASGLNTFSFSVMGRNMLNLTGASTPYFTSGTAEATTGITAAVNGLLLFGNTAVGVITGATISLDLSPSNAPVVGQDFVAEIFLGRANVTGQLSAYLADTTILAGFLAETEFTLLLVVANTSAAASSAISIYLPRIKLTSADVGTQGEGGQMITSNFQALRYVGAAPGRNLTTIRIHDTDA